MIAELLTDALRRKGWSIAAAARECGVNRVFLNRLVTGQVPPRARDRRLTAEHDERYRKLAVGLELPDPDGFIKEVARVQKAASNPAPTILSERYPHFSQQITKNQPHLRHEKGLLRLMSDCLGTAIGSPQADTLNEKVRKHLGESGPIMQPYVDYDYLGIVSNPPLPSLVSQRVRTCREIAGILVELDDPQEAWSDARIDACVEIAMLFYDLALLDDL